MLMAVEKNYLIIFLNFVGNLYRFIGQIVNIHSIDQVKILFIGILLARFIISLTCPFNMCYPLIDLMYNFLWLVGGIFIVLYNQNETIDQKENVDKTSINSVEIDESNNLIMINQSNSDNSKISAEYSPLGNGSS
jgi:hypothetical protein